MLAERQLRDREVAWEGSRRQSAGRRLSTFIRKDLNPFLRGWFNYYRTSDQLKRFCQEMDAWVRRRLRNIVWRQWKRPWTRFRNLIALGLDEERAARAALNKRGPWSNSGARHMNEALPRRHFAALGWFSLLHHWTTQNESTVGTAVLRNRMPGGVRGG